MMIMKSSTLAAAIIIAVVAVGGISAYYFLGTGTAPKPSEPSRFKAGDSFPFAEQFFLVEMAGQDKGYYKNNYVEPEFVSFRGSSLLYQAVAAGQVSIGYGICPDVIASRSNGVPIKIVAAYVSGNPWEVLVKGNSTLQSVKDLDGKRVGTSGIRGIDHLLGVLIEENYNIKMEFVPLGGVPQMLAGLRSGDIDAFIQTPGPTQALADAGQLRVLFKADNIVPKPWSSFCVWATDDMIKNNGDAVSRFVKSTLETVSYIQNNSSYTDNLYIRKTNSSAVVASKVVGGIQWSPSGQVSEDMLRNLISAYQRGGDVPTNSTMKIQDTYTNQFVKGP